RPHPSTVPVTASARTTHAPSAENRATVTAARRGSTCADGARTSARPSTPPSHTAPATTWSASAVTTSHGGPYVRVCPTSTSEASASADAPSTAPAGPAARV